MGIFRITRGVALVGRVQLANGVTIFDSVAAPINGRTGAGWAEKGSLCLRTSGKAYVNTGTKASPVWTPIFIGAASESPSTSPSKSPSASQSPSSSVSQSRSPSVSPSASKSPSASASPSVSPS